MTESERTGPRYDLEQIRNRLRGLGYLEHSLGGWLVPGRRGALSIVRLNLLSSLRAGILGGPLLALPATMGISVANRPHFDSAGSLLFLFVYLTLILGTALALLEFLTDMGLAWLARRGLILVGRMERLAGRVGLLFMVATTLYLASILRTGWTAGPRDGSVMEWVVWAAGLLIALGVGHVVGRLTRVGSLIAVISATPAGAGPASRRAGPPRLFAVTAGLFLAGIAGLLVFAPGGGGETPGDPFDITPTPGRVIFAGVDGLDRGLLERVAGSGCCPHLAGLLESGSFHVLGPETDEPPPVAWTSIATGRHPEDHGVLGYRADRIPGLETPVQETDPGSGLSLTLLVPPLPGYQSPVSANLRRVPALWEILASGGETTATINWWATWPVPEDGGVVVSERAFVRFGSGLEPNRDAAPASLQARLARTFEADMREVRENSEWISLRDADDLLARAAETDAYHGLIAARIMRDMEPRFLFVYFPGLDILRAKPLPGMDREKTTPSEEALLRLLDRFVGEVTAAPGPADLMILAGTPGRGAKRGEEGFLIVSGERARRDSAGRLSPFDIAPTLLALGGFPVARDMPGEARLDFLAPGDPGQGEVAYIGSYGTRPGDSLRGEKDPLDPEVLERLRSLGYID